MCFNDFRCFAEPCPHNSSAVGPSFLQDRNVEALIGAADWSQSPLGPPEQWPQTLKSTISVILPSAAQIVLFWGPEFVAVYNDAYAPTIGEKHPRALGRPARENWSELWDDLEPLLLSVRESGETVHAKDRPFYIERHGYPETVYFDISYSAVSDDQGGVGGVLCIVSETTDRVMGEEALRESEERLRLAVDNAEIGFWDVEEGHGNLTWPARTKAMFGISPNVPVTMDDFYNGLHPDDRERVAEAYRAAADPVRRALYDVEYRTIGKEDGVVRWVAAKGRGIFADDGPNARCLRVIGTAVDISARKRADEAVSIERHTLEVLNRTGPAIAAELDLERVVQLVTDAGVELTGAQFGAFFYNVINEAGESYTLYTLSGVPRSAFEKFPMPRNTHVFGPTFRGEGTVRSDDITKDPRYGKNPPFYGKPEGHLPVVSYLAVPVISRTGEVIGGLFFGHPEVGQFNERHDRLMEGIAAQAAIAIDNARLYRAAQHEIEQRVTAEKALTALNETLETRVAEEIERRSQAEEVLRQAQKMETVGQLSGGIAHDFNNLLQVIHGNLSMLQQALPETDAKLRRSVANALSGTERAAALTKRLLAFSRRQPLNPRPIDVNRLIGDMTDLLHRTLGETIVVDTRLSPDVPAALIDANQLENAILNLAINARDAMPSGGRLEIATAAADLDEAQADVAGEGASGRYVRITVRDDGHGMSPAILDRAIEPFFSTKEVGQGTGLGLSTVYGFMRQSGGHLMLQSSEGSGTSVELYLPCANRPSEEAVRDKPAVAPSRGKGERILLCEDDDGVRMFSSEALRDLGYEVIEAGDVQSAISALLDSGRIDLLFTDVVLPGGRTGADLAREARKLQPDVKVLFTTGYARSALDREQRAEKAVKLLLKPFSMDELATKVREVLN
jgi:PAS domain S-box-containing protein